MLWKEDYGETHSEYELELILEKTFYVKYLNYLPFVFGTGLKLSRALEGHWVPAKRDMAWMQSFPPIVL